MLGNGIGIDDSAVYTIKRKRSVSIYSIFHVNLHSFIHHYSPTVKLLSLSKLSEVYWSRLARMMLARWWSAQRWLARRLSARRWLARMLSSEAVGLEVVGSPVVGSEVVGLDAVELVFVSWNAVGLVVVS